MDKLGTTTQYATAVMVDIAALRMGGDAANGPEDLIDWDAIAWRDQEAQVQRLRQRIFKATQAGDLRQVRNLQKLMLRSRANTLVSVRWVSQHNPGRHTAGVDGQVALTCEARADLAMLLAPPGRTGPRAAGAAGVHSQKRRETPTRDSSYRRPRPAATGA
jgi:RNA-directed DNA polymerase